MAMSCPCSGCGENTTAIVLAQYMIRHKDRDKDEEAYICIECYQDKGFRCYTTEENKLVVKQEQPPNTVRTRIYWDEGGYVTDAKDCSDWTYFD